MIKKELDVRDIISFLKDEILAVYGPQNGTVTNICDSTHVNELTLDWVNSTRNDKQEIVKSTPAKTILVDDSIIYTDELEKQEKTLLVVRNPRRALAYVGNHFFVANPSTTIHSTSIIDEDAIIGENVSIGAYSNIGKAKIGKGSVIGSFVRIYDDVVIGDYCYIKDGAVIGGLGFGYEVDNSGNRFRFPQLGGVIIGNNVDIGSNTCIDRGALSDTIIEDYVKIDNLVHVAHNVQIRKNAMITACSEISGSCVIGEKAWLGPNSSIRDWRSVGKETIVGIGTNVVKNIPSKEVWAGNPAKKLK